jgi:hypothetical protein
MNTNSGLCLKGGVKILWIPVYASGYNRLGSIQFWPEVAASELLSKIVEILTRITNSRRVLENPLTAPGYTFEVNLYLAATLSMSRV